MTVHDILKLLQRVQSARNPTDPDLNPEIVTKMIYVY